MAVEPSTSDHSTTSSEDYRVPGEPGVFWCARHKNVKTRLRCGRCEKPICPKCTKMGPTGARCPDCASNRSSHMYQVSPLQFIAAFAVAFVSSVLAGFLVQILGIFLLLFYAPVVGTFIGKAVVAVVRGKRGVPLAVVASAGVVLGALIPFAITLSRTMQVPGMPPETLLYPLGSVGVYAALAVSGVWYWLR
jgi:hypothetical protein